MSITDAENSSKYLGWESYHHPVINQMMLQQNISATNTVDKKYNHTIYQQGRKEMEWNLYMCRSLRFYWVHDIYTMI